MSRRAVFVWILLAGVLACGPQRPPSSETPRPCVSPSREARRLLQFQHTSRHDSQALDSGRYRFELTHQSYSAACDIDVSSVAERQAGKVAWSATCEGDELEIGSFFDRVFGLVVPMHLQNVRARVMRDRAVVFDDGVTATSQCHGSMDAPGVPEPVEGPGALCLSFSTERWEAETRGRSCERRFVGEPRQALRFTDGDEDSSGLGGGAYRFALDGDGYSAACDVTVPTPERPAGEVEVHCSGDELAVFTGVRRILFLVLPARLRSVRVHATRDSVLVFDGVASGAAACEGGNAPRGLGNLCFYLAPDSATLPVRDAGE